jgi:hypothetical protein
MSTKKSPKANYKVYDRKLGKFISPGYKSKSTWNSEGWALSAAWDHAHNQTRSKNKGVIEQYMAENMDLYIYPIESAIVETLADRMEANRKAAEERREAEAKKAEEKKAREIEDHKKYLHMQIEMLQEELDLLNKQQ